jgi:hypothetical protein
MYLTTSEPTAVAQLHLSAIPGRALIMILLGLKIKINRGLFGMLQNFADLYMFFTEVLLSSVTFRLSLDLF